MRIPLKLSTYSGDVVHFTERSDAGGTKYESSGHHQSRKTRGGSYDSIISFFLENGGLSQTLTKSPPETSQFSSERILCKGCLLLLLARLLSDVFESKASPAAGF